LRRTLRPPGVRRPAPPVTRTRWPPGVRRPAPPLRRTWRPPVVLRPAPPSRTTRRPPGGRQCAPPLRRSRRPPDVRQPAPPLTRTPRLPDFRRPAPPLTRTQRPPGVRRPPASPLAWTWWLLDSWGPDPATVPERRRQLLAQRSVAAAIRSARRRSVGFPPATAQRSARGKKRSWMPASASGAVRKWRNGVAAWAPAIAEVPVRRGHPLRDAQARLTSLLPALVRLVLDLNAHRTRWGRWTPLSTAAADFLTQGSKRHANHPGSSPQ